MFFTRGQIPDPRSILFIISNFEQFRNFSLPNPGRVAKVGKLGEAGMGVGVLEWVIGDW
jgi:hypothetical protein